MERKRGRDVRERIVGSGDIDGIGIGREAESVNDIDIDRGVEKGIGIGADMMIEGTEVGVQIEESAGTAVEVEIGADREGMTESQDEMIEIQEEVRIGDHEEVDRLIPEIVEEEETEQRHSRYMTNLGN